MARFRRDNGKSIPKCKFIGLLIRDDIDEEFKRIAKESDMTYSDLLKIMMDGNKINGKYAAPLINNLAKLMEDFQNGTGLFGS